MSQLSQLFTVHTISESATGIDKDVDVLMLVHPKNLSQPLLFAIDQYVLRGGRAVIFVDPRAEARPGSAAGHADVCTGRQWAG